MNDVGSRVKDCAKHDKGKKIPHTNDFIDFSFKITKEKLSSVTYENFSDFKNFIQKIH